MQPAGRGHVAEEIKTQGAGAHLNACCSLRLPAWPCLTACVLTRPVHDIMQACSARSARHGAPIYSTPLPTSSIPALHHHHYRGACLSVCLAAPTTAAPMPSTAGYTSFASNGAQPTLAAPGAHGTNEVSGAASAYLLSPMCYALIKTNALRLRRIWPRSAQQCAAGLTLCPWFTACSVTS